MRIEAKTPRAMSFYQSSLPGVLQEAATWLQDEDAGVVAHLLVSEDADGDWWVVVYWYPTVESDRVERATKDNTA